MSDRMQNQGGRTGATAKGGIDPQPGDPASPAQARARSAAEDAALHEDGFGDDKGASIDRPESPQPR